MCVWEGGDDGYVILDKPLQFIVDQVKQSEPFVLLCFYLGLSSPTLVYA